MFLPPLSSTINAFLTLLKRGVTFSSIGTLEGCHAHVEKCKTLSDSALTPHKYK